MKYILIILDILCCLLWAGAAITATDKSSMMMNAACSVMWTASIVFNVLAYFKNKK